MRPTTDIDPRTGAPSNATAIRLVLAATLVIVLAIAARSTYSPYGQGEWKFAFYPFQYAWEKAGADALATYSGQTPAVVSTREMAVVLCGVLFSMVVIPTLFLYGLRERLVNVRKNVLPSAGWLASMVIVAGIFLNTTISALFQEQVFDDARAGQTLQLTKRLLVDQLAGISVRAREYYILPTSLRGGGHSLDGFSIPSEYVSTSNTAYSVERTASGLVVRATVFADPITSERVAAQPQAPIGTVSAEIDSTGHLRGWTYTDAFER